MVFYNGSLHFSPSRGATGGEVVGLGGFHFATPPYSWVMGLFLVFILINLGPQASSSLMKVFSRSVGPLLRQIIGA